MTDNLPTWAREALERAEAATEGPWLVNPQEGISESDLGIYTKLQTGYGLGVIWGNLAQYENNVQNNAAFIAHARTDVPRLCEALAEALAALEPLAKVAVLFGNTTPDSHIINTSLHSNVRIYQATITVGDARRAAEVLDDQVRDEMPEVRR